MRPAGLLVFVVLVSAWSGIMAQFNPTMIIETCSQSTLVLTLVDASDTGIVYIRDSGAAACKQPTSSGTTQHSIDFAACGISLENTFTVVVQKHWKYQTGSDIHIRVMCIADLNADLNVGLSGESEDNSGQNKTVKPTATMRLYKDGIDVSGGSVKLTDTITMVIQLDANYRQDFDIRARECSASTIPITKSYCPTEPDLFPQFNRIAQGELSVTFGAFRTTDLNGGTVTMPFTCAVEVCLGACPEVTTCADGSTGHGRKRRFADKLSDTGIGDINVGLAIYVVTEEMVLDGSREVDVMCMEQTLFVVIVATIVGGATAGAVGTGIMFRKLRLKVVMVTVLTGDGNRDFINAA